MILSRERYCDTSPSLPEPLKVSKQNPQNESPSKLRHAPCTPETRRVVRGLLDAYREKPRPDTKQESRHSDCASRMWCHSGTCISPRFPETIARLLVRSEEHKSELQSPM